MMLLMAWMGLRAGEVAGLRLDDIGWRHGEVTIRGKPNRRDRLPLLAEAGEAIAAYLKDGRPRPRWTAACSARSRPRAGA